MDENKTNCDLQFEDFIYDIVISEQRNDPQNEVRIWMVESIGEVRKQMQGCTLGG